MRSVSDFRRDCLVLLGDETGRRFSDSILDMGLREALDQYRAYCPRKETVRQKILDCEGGGMMVLPGFLDSGVEILTVRDEKGTWLSFSEYRNEKNVYIQLPFSADLPAVGDVLELELSCPHTIKGLDEGKVTTIPDGYGLILCTGAAGYAMRIRARSVTEVFGKRPEDREALSSQANRLISDFENDLKKISLTASFQQNPWPVSNFRI